MDHRYMGNQIFVFNDNRLNLFQIDRLTPVNYIIDVPDPEPVADLLHPLTIGPVVENESRPVTGDYRGQARF